MNSTFLKLFHIALSIAFGLFFMYAGIKKFIPKKARVSSTTELVDAVSNNKIEKPISFKLAVKALKASGYLYMVGVFQILGGLLALFNTTRLLGLFVLLPLTINIFCFHLFMDNRMDENMETGLLLFANLLLVLFYTKKLKQILITK